MTLPNDPRCGTYAGAIAHYRRGEETCPPCKVAARRKRKRNHLDTLHGNPAHRPLGHAAWQIVHETPRSILARQTGIRHDKLHRYDHGGPDKIVHRDTQARILAAGNHWTPAGVQRRLQALSVLGWSMLHVAEHAGVDVDSVKRLRRRADPKFVRHDFAHRIIATYDDLSMRIPPAGRSATKTRTEAAGRGWVPPLAWNNIDDPAATPQGIDHEPNRGIYPLRLDHAVVERILDGDWRLPCSRTEKAEVARRWVRNGGSSTRLAALTGWKVERYYRHNEQEAMGGIARKRIEKLHEAARALLDEEDTRGA